MKSRRATDTWRGMSPPRPPAAASRENACGWNSASRRSADAGLTSTGLLIVNPPWTLAGELKTILPELEKPLGQGGAGRFRLEIAEAVTCSWLSNAQFSPIGNLPGTVLCSAYWTGFTFRFRKW